MPVPVTVPDVSTGGGFSSPSVAIGYPVVVPGVTSEALFSGVTGLIYAVVPDILTVNMFSGAGLALHIPIPDIVSTGTFIVPEPSQINLAEMGLITLLNSS